MHNLILDKLPDNYKGYLIRSDFRIGLQICSCLKDFKLNKDEQSSICFKLLYGNSLPPIKIAVDGLIWFLNLGEIPDEKETKYSIGKDVMDFDIDSTRIFSGFMSTFGINLNTVKMHWFEFRYLLFELRDCYMSDIVEIRQKDIKDVPKENRIMYQRLQKMYSIDNTDEKLQWELMKKLNKK